MRENVEGGLPLCWSSMANSTTAMLPGWPPVDECLWQAQGGKVVGLGLEHSLQRVQRSQGQHCDRAATGGVGKAHQPTEF